MSWTQGIQTREDMRASTIKRLEDQYTKITGESDRLEYITWHEIDRSDAIAVFEGGRAFKIGKP